MPETIRHREELMIRTPGAPFARLSAGAFATVAILFTWAAPLAHAQASRCDASLHGFCFNVQLASCPTVNRVCGYDDGSVGFVCACRPACTNSQSCNADEACFKGNCNAHVACNNATDCVTSGIADAACSSDGVCVKAPPPPPPGCTADASLCRTDNACSGTRSCDAASGSCVTGPPVSCPQPGPVIERAPDGTFVIVGQHARARVVGGARVTNAAFTPAKGPLAPPSPKTILYAIETGIGWAERSRLDLQRIQPSCTVVVGDCQRSASGGLNCHVPGWKAGGKG